MQSFQHHIGTIQNLNLSMNNLSLSGAEYLASTIPNMRSIKYLDLNDCHLSDRGVAAIVAKLDEHTSLDVLNLSANQIGQSSYFKDSANMLCVYLQKQTQLAELYLDSNMLRGPLGYEIIDAVSQHSTLNTLGVSNNFLGQKDKCIEPPAALFSRMLIYSRLIEKLDLGYNQIDQECCFSLAHGLRLSKSIVKLSLEANPIGNQGMRQLMKAKNEN